MNVMILAAGRGERLRPLTDRIPKPLIEVGGKALVVHHLEALAAAGFQRVVINTAWLGEQIEQALGDGQRWNLTIVYSREPEGALETAGGIVQALPLLGHDPFLVISADIVCDYPLEQLKGLRPEGLGHLVMVDNPDHHPQGDFQLDASGKLRRGSPALTFGGIGVFRPELFDGCSFGRLALRPLLERALAEERLTGERHAGLWSDVGSPERLQAIRRQHCDDGSQGLHFHP